MKKDSLSKVHPASTGTIKWSCPSNIAIVKYWGKGPGQLPKNPSLSLTLQKSLTLTEISYKYEPSSTAKKISFSFEGEQHPAFHRRISDYIRSLHPLLPWLEHTSMVIKSFNTFPHSSGIASSASAMGALAACLVSIEEEITGTRVNDPLSKASFLARLGSGSASRSLYPGFALWGHSEAWALSSDEYAIPISGIHDTFTGMHDSILIVDPGKKKISSSAGHALMESNPYASTRFKQASENVSKLKQILLEGSWNRFINLMEEEALALHAMMLSSRPGFILMLPGTLEIIRKIRDFRMESGFHLGFTLDAGPNVHLIYDSAHANQVRAFITSDLIQHCKNKQVIHDEMGTGPSIQKI